MAYNPQKPEQIFKLKDGRILFKTHNGFKHHIKDKKGNISEVTSEYWKNIFQNKKNNPQQLNSI